MVVHKTVLVCQHRACRKAGAEKVLSAFQTSPLSNVEIKPIRCLGQCGDGPMVVILPEQTWYGKVHPDEVPGIVKQHLRAGKPIKAMLYRKFHLNE